MELQVGQKVTIRRRKMLSNGSFDTENLTITINSIPEIGPILGIKDFKTKKKIPFSEKEVLYIG